MSLLSAVPMVFMPIADAWGRHHGGWPWLWGPMMFLFWILIVFLVVRLLNRGCGWRGRSGVDRARDILAERYARGELSSEEFRERLDQLR